MTDDEFHDANDEDVEVLAEVINSAKKKNKKKKKTKNQTTDEAEPQPDSEPSEGPSESSSVYDETQEIIPNIPESIPEDVAEDNNYQLQGNGDEAEAEAEDMTNTTIRLEQSDTPTEIAADKEDQHEIEHGIEQEPQYEHADSQKETEPVSEILNTSYQDEAENDLVGELKLPNRRQLKDVVSLDLAPSSHYGSLGSEIPQSASSRNVSSASANFLLESKFSQLDKDFQAKDSKSKEYIQSGTQNIKKTFKDIKDTVGGFGDMFGYKIDWEFWTRVVNDYHQVVTEETDVLNEKITKGIPKEFRGIIWQLISKSKNFQLEEFYLQLKNETSIHEKGIKRDLTRTSFFTHVEQVGKADELFNVIKAYSLFDPDVGYTQGMIFVGVPLIMNMTDLECFCLLVTIMKEYNLRSLFCPEMKGLHLLLYQFDRLMEMYCPRLFNHLVKQGIKSSMFASQWFLTFFAYKFPLDIVLRIYDIIITQGMESILKFALNLMMKNESNLLALRFDLLLEFLKDKLFNYYVNEEYIEGSTDSLNNSTRTSRTASVSRRFSILGKRNTVGTSTSSNASSSNNGYYKLDDLVSDSMEINVQPSDLERFEYEFEQIFLKERSKEDDIQELKEQNGELRHEIKQLELQYSNLHRDHIEIMQEMVDLKVSLPEVKSDNMDLQVIIDQLNEDLHELESKIKDTSVPGELEDISISEGGKATNLPTNIESDINELLLINAQETERFANLEDELEQLIISEEELDRELEVLKGNKKWFRW